MSVWNRGVTVGTKNGATILVVGLTTGGHDPANPPSHPNDTATDITINRVDRAAVVNYYAITPGITLQSVEAADPRKPEPPNIDCDASGGTLSIRDSNGTTFDWPYRLVGSYNGATVKTDPQIHNTAQLPA